MKERWIDIVEPIILNGRMMISDHGRIYSLITNKILKMSISKTGYHIISTRPEGRKGKCICIKLHRLVALHFVAGYKDGLFVNHKDGNKLNNHYTNLEWVTAKENSVHAKENGLFNTRKGSEVLSSKLNEDIVKFLRENKNVIVNKYKRKLFCDLFSVGRHTFFDALNNETWKHVNAQPLTEITNENLNKFKKLLEQKYNKEQVEKLLKKVLDN